jgi:hypothetical protein
MKDKCHEIATILVLTKGMDDRWGLKSLRQDKRGSLSFYKEGDKGDPYC